MAKCSSLCGTPVSGRNQAGTRDRTVMTTTRNQPVVRAAVVAKSFACQLVNNTLSRIEDRFRQSELARCGVKPQRPAVDFPHRAGGAGKTSQRHALGRCCDATDKPLLTIAVHSDPVGRCRGAAKGLLLAQLKGTFSNLSRGRKFTCLRHGVSGAGAIRFRRRADLFEGARA